MKHGTLETSDQILIEQVTAGDKSKMGVLYERHSQDLFKYFVRLTRDRGKSEDLVQNVFLRMLKYSHNFKGEGKFTYWMFSIARNTWIDEHRKSNPLKKMKELDNVDQKYMEDPVDLQQEVEHRERKEILQYALDQLAPEKKEAIVLSRFHDMKYQDIAKIANCTESTVKSRIRRGIAEMQVIVQTIH